MSTRKANKVVGIELCKILGDENSHSGYKFRVLKKKLFACRGLYSCGAVDEVIRSCDKEEWQYFINREAENE